MKGKIAEYKDQCRSLIRRISAEEQLMARKTEEEEMVQAATVELIQDLLNSKRTVTNCSSCCMIYDICCSFSKKGRPSKRGCKF